MKEQEQSLEGRSPRELAEQFTNIIYLLGQSSPHQFRLEGQMLFGVMDCEDTESEARIRLNSNIRSSVDELLNQSKITNSYKTYIKESIEERFSSNVIRFAETLWFGGSAMPLLRRCGIDLDYKTVDFYATSQEIGIKSIVDNPQLGIFDSDENNLKTLEKDILKYELEESGWLSGEENKRRMQKLEEWANDFTQKYNEDPPVAFKGGYEHSIIRELWIESQPL